MEKEPVASCILVAMLLAAPVSAQEDPHWSYSAETGPDHWSDLSDEYSLCGSGTQQSPLDIGEAVDAELEQLEISWPITGWSVVNDGYTVQLQTDQPGHAVIDGQRYEFVQLHFHAPSEHAIGGERVAMEAHFVHQNDGGDLAVIAIRLSAGGSPGPLDRIMAVAPSGPEPVALGDLRPEALLPEDRSYYRYYGSLTTPPCSETVIWTVLRDSVPVSDVSVAAFRELIGENARPIQATARRSILSAQP